MSNLGFLSIVANKDDFNTLLVRARAAGHIESIFPKAEVFTDEGADYFYRAFIPRYEVSDAIAREVDSISYTNFKNSVKDKEYHDCLLGVWHCMHTFQERLLDKIFRKNKIGKKLFRHPFSNDITDTAI